jgi:hypothetical protein
MSDATGTLTEAILEILNADTAIRTACGRTTECAIAWGALDLEQDPLPILAVEDVNEGDSFLEDSRSVTFVIAAFASGPEADAITGNLLGLVEAALTTPAFTALDLDAGVDPTSQPFPRDRVLVRDVAIPDLVQRTIAPTFLITP